MLFLSIDIKCLYLSFTGYTILGGKFFLPPGRTMMKFTYSHHTHTHTQYIGQAVYLVRLITLPFCYQSLLVMYLLDLKGSSENVGPDRYIQTLRLFTVVTCNYLQMQPIPLPYSGAVNLIYVIRAQVMKFEMHVAFLALLHLHQSILINLLSLKCTIFLLITSASSQVYRHDLLGQTNITWSFLHANLKFNILLQVC